MLQYKYDLGLPRTDTPVFQLAGAPADVRVQQLQKTSPRARSLCAAAPQAQEDARSAGQCQSQATSRV